MTDIEGFLTIYGHSDNLLNNKIRYPARPRSYADLAMDEIDLRAKFSGPIKPSLWWRYRDEVFDLWQQGLPALHQFTEYINSLYPTIKFELVFSEHELHVLDLTLHLVDGFIRTDVVQRIPC